MKDQVKDMFAEITMPEETVRKIEQAMVEKRKPAKLFSGGFGRSAAAVAAMLALVLAISPEARAAVSDFVTTYIFPDSGITIYEETDENGNLSRSMALDTESETFAYVQDGRLYFTGNGENIDITEEITQEKPYYYSYTDAYGFVHYMAVGYSGSLENFGVYEFLREEKEGMEAWEGWSNGYGRNFLDPETETRYPWVEVVWEDLNVPWPMPGM